MTETSKKTQEIGAGAGPLPWFVRGLRDGIPICMGYFAVSFALGITARGIGMNALQAGLMSMGMVASAGEFAAIVLIASHAGVFEMITTCIVVNMRYFLMSCSLSQKLSPDLPFYHRFMLPYCITDEIFGLSSAVKGYLDPKYTYGMTIVSVAGWTTGTVLGVLLGNIMPAWARRPGPDLHDSKRAVLRSACSQRDLRRLQGDHPHTGDRRRGGTGPSRGRKEQRMNHSVYFSLLIMCLTVYCIRMLPFLVFRKEITNRWLRSFLYYVPYVTLAVMTFPAIVTATDNIWSGIAALVVGLLAAWFKGDLFFVAVSCCATVFLTGLFL